MPTLALTLPFRVTATEDSISIEPKTLSGLEEYARLWDGDMVLVATHGTHRDGWDDLQHGITAIRCDTYPRPNFHVAGHQP
ncbi:hypothetical protein TPCV2_08280 [Cutibacterium avidum]